MAALVPNALPLFLEKRIRSFHRALYSMVMLFIVVPDGQAAPNTTSTAAQLHEWQILTGPNNADIPAHRYALFLQKHPQRWPLQNRILWRYQNALVRDDSSADRPQLCPSLPITQWKTLTVCAPYVKDLAQRAQSLWVSSVDGEDDEKLFLSHYQPFLTPSDQWKRYVYLETTGQKSAAQRQIDRLRLSDQRQARARFAQRFNGPNADDVFSQATHPYDPSLLLLRLKYLRHQARYDEALQLWQQIGLTAEQHTLLPHKTPWITERLALARLLLRQPQGDTPTKALLLITAPSHSVTTFVEQEERLLGAYIHLVLLNEPANAAALLQPLLNSSALSARAAGIYWSARCEEAQHHPERAQQRYEQAQSYPTTFYGQLALATLTHSPYLSQSQRSENFLAALKQQLNNLPTVETGNVVRPDLAEAARLLHDQGDDNNATLFLNAIQGETRKLADQKAIADVALSLHSAQPAILAARVLARHGRVLFPEGYPQSPQLSSLGLKTLPQGLVAALIRQESSANPYAFSPRHAVGLMQLLPSTAHLTARHHNVSIPSLSAQSLTNPSINLTLGQLYLQELMERFNNTLPYVLAAYNAGPGRVRRWNNDTLSSLSDQAHNITDDDRLLHWLMTLPYQETRFYIEHIETDMSLYAVLPPE